MLVFYVQPYKDYRRLLTTSLMRRDGNRYNFIDTSSIINSAYQSNSLSIPLLIPDQFSVWKKGGLH